MVLNRNPKGNFFHIFGNNLKIRPVRPIKISDGTTPHGDLSYDTLFAKIRPAVSGGDLRTKLGGRKRKRKIKRKKK